MSDSAPNQDDIEQARKLLIALCSDARGITIPARKKIEDAEQVISQALMEARKSGERNALRSLWDSYKNKRSGNV